MSNVEMPLRGSEATQLQFFWSLIKTLRDNRTLKPRMSALGIWWRYRGLLRQAENMCRDCFRSMPQETYERFEAAMELQELRIVTRGGAVDASGDYMVVPRAAMIDVLHTASKECMLCDGSGEERRKCSYRKAVKKLCLPDLSHVEDNGICLGKQFDWKGGE